MDTASGINTALRLARLGAKDPANVNESGVCLGCENCPGGKNGPNGASGKSVGKGLTSFPSSVSRRASVLNAARKRPKGFTSPDQVAAREADIVAGVLAGDPLSEWLLQVTRALHQVTHEEAEGCCEQIGHPSGKVRLTAGQVAALGIRTVAA